MSQPERCSDASAEAGEPLAGTAAHVENWLLVELRGTWPRDVSDVVGAGGPGTEALRSWLGATPASRLLFARRPGARPGGVRAFVVRAAPHEEEVRRFELEYVPVVAAARCACDTPLMVSRRARAMSARMSLACW